MAMALIHLSWVSTSATSGSGIPGLQCASRGRAPVAKGGIFFLAFAHYTPKDLLETEGSNFSPSLHPWLQLRGHKKEGLALGRVFNRFAANAEPCA